MLRSIGTGGQSSGLCGTQRISSCAQTHTPHRAHAVSTRPSSGRTHRHAEGLGGDGRVGNARRLERAVEHVGHVRAVSRGGARHDDQRGLAGLGHFVLSVGLAPTVRAAVHRLQSVGRAGRGDEGGAALDVLERVAACGHGVNRRTG